MYITLRQLMAVGLCEQSIDTNFRILVKLAGPQSNHDGSQVPSFDPKTKLTKSLPNLHNYTTHSKRRPPVLSLKYHCKYGKQWIETSTSSESPFVLGSLANLFVFRTMPKSTGTGVAYIYLICLWTTFEMAS